MLKVRKLELNNLNHIEFNHTFNDVVPSIGLSLRYGVLMDVFPGRNFVSVLAR